MFCCCRGEQICISILNRYNLTFLLFQSGYTSFGKEHKDPGSLDGLVDQLCQLNEFVPAFGTVDPGSVTDQSVQRPLQEMFASLVDTYLWMVSYLRGMPLGKLCQDLVQL